jgi:hypothetical protein
MATAILPGPAADTSRGRRSSAPPAPRLDRADHWSEARDPETGRKHCFHIREPYINDATRAQINAAQADKTYAAFWRLVFKEQAKGRTAAIRMSAARFASLDDVGIKGLAKEAGVAPSTARRHLDILVDQIGILGMGASPVTFLRDESPRGTLDENGRPVRGRIVGKAAGSAGRQKPIRIWFTLQERHAIPAAKPRNPRKSYGAPCALGSGDGGPVMAHGAPASREEEEITTPPVAGTAGVGAALAEEGAGRQEAAAEGGQEAASQEDEAKGERRRVWPSADAPAHVAKPAPRPPRPRSDDGHEPPKKSAAEYAAEFFRRDPERDRMTREYLAAKAAKRAQGAESASRPASTTPEPDRPSETIPGAPDGSPATIPFPAADADDLTELVTGRRRQDAAVARASQRDAYHRDRAQG